MKKVSENQEGYAILEAVVFLTAFMIVAVYSIDFFAAIHTGVLGNIHSRTYLFETLRHRADIEFLRPYPNDQGKWYSFVKDDPKHERFHAINDEAQTTTDAIHVTSRVLTAANDQHPADGNPGTGSLGTQKQATVLYIKSGYGICTDGQCRGD